MKVLIKNEGETKKLAKLLAKEVCESLALRKRTIVIGLKGELGSGKTKFTQAFAKGLGIKEHLTSPSFVLMKQYNNFYHIDCYRLNKPEELIDLGFKEIINNPENIIMIEWAERVRKILPKKTIWIEFKVISEKERKIVINL